MPEALQHNLSNNSSRFYQLAPPEVMKRWPALRDILVTSMNPYSALTVEAVHNLKMAALKGRLLLWICADERIVKGLVALSLREDPITLERVVYIESIVVIEGATKEDWDAGIALIRRFAKDSNAHKIIGHVPVGQESLVEHYLKKEAKVTHQLLELPL